MSGPVTLQSHEFFAAGEDAAMAELRNKSQPPSPRPVTMAPPHGPSDRTPARGDDEPIVMPASKAPWVVAALLLVAASFVSAALFMQLREERRQRAEATAAHAAALAAADDKVAKARADAAERDVKIAQLERDLSDVARQKEEQAAELARLKQLEAQLGERVSSEIIAGDIRLVSKGNRLSVDLVDKLLFNSGEAEVSERGKEVLARLATVLAKVEDRNIEIIGHTDDAPPTAKIREKFPTNWELSVARATNVVRFLQEQSKISGKRLVAIGRGQFQPVASNANGKGRARNRRIEIQLW